MKTINFSALIRPHLIGIAPYSSARDDFNGEGHLFLDANESPFDTGLNRYPDPHQFRIKEFLGQMKQVNADRIFLGNGSDEAIDLLMRAFCEPGEDNIIILPPTYGMYKVSAAINGIEVKEVRLDDSFDLDIPQILQAISPHTKLIFICSPNNPTGNKVDRLRVKNLLDVFEGLIVVDEAYIDFSEDQSLVSWLPNYQNLIVLQTFSKAWGLAAIRMGICLADPQIISLLNKIKPPYNISGPNQRIAEMALRQGETVTDTIRIIKSQRSELIKELRNLPFIKKIFPSDANFLLVKTTHADGLYKYLTKHGIIVRNRSREPGCENCLRITVGTPLENKMLIEKLKTYA